jgi:uncharacterized FAD-dependent dehydrogenase
MSNHSKSGRFSNAAVVAAVSADDLQTLGYHGIDAALALQSDLEGRFRSAVNQAGRCDVVPGQLLADFLSGRASRQLGEGSCLNPTAPAPLHALFPELITQRLRRGFSAFESSMRGFTKGAEAQVYGVESRTSAPYRIGRCAEAGTSPTHANLYPIGEGAGYAGGITSAAVDGIKSAQRYIGQFIEGVDFARIAGSGEDEMEKPSAEAPAGEVRGNTYICG